MILLLSQSLNPFLAALVFFIPLTLNHSLTTDSNDLRISHIFLQNVDPERFIFFLQIVESWDSIHVFFKVVIVSV